MMSSIEGIDTSVQLLPTMGGSLTSRPKQRAVISEILGEVGNDVSVFDRAGWEGRDSRYGVQSELELLLLSLGEEGRSFT
jgi:hypothetical protein